MEMSQMIRESRKMVQSVPYGKIKDFTEPLTAKKYGELSKKELCRIAYINTVALHAARKQYEELYLKHNPKPKEGKSL